MDTSESAAHGLLNKTLKSGWLVTEKLTKDDNATGSYFSVCYKVEKDGEICFLKAFDFAKFNSIAEAGKEVADVMGDMIKAYQYERDLSNHCRNFHVTHVSFVREAGEENLMGYTYPLVLYLIFELADGDVRKKLALSEKLDLAWKLRSLHEIAVGIKQLHAIGVSHQDVKPSNILVFDQISKLGDMGRSVCKHLNSPYKEFVFTGDRAYVPPEIMYSYWDEDWTNRSYAIDCYLLGSMIVFYFTRICMSALLMKNMPENFLREYGQGHFDDVKPYLLDGFSKAMIEFERSLPKGFEKEIKELVEQLCYPLPEERGHPKTIFSRGNSFNLERFISKLDYLKNKAEYQIKEPIGQPI